MNLNKLIAALPMFFGRGRAFEVLRAGEPITIELRAMTDAQVESLPEI